VRCEDYVQKGFLLNLIRKKIMFMVIKVASLIGQLRLVQVVVGWSVILK
jgi:hypothetical protein